MHETLIVVPCFNEERRLRPDSFLRFVENAPNVGFVMVDDGSSDGTARLLDRLVASAPRDFRVLTMPYNVGKAEAVRQGTLAALADGCQMVGYWDADLATPLESIHDFRAVLRRRPTIDVVLGTRLRLLGRAIHRQTLRRIAGRAFAFAASRVLGLSVYDTQCGAKLFRTTPQLAQAFQAPFATRWIFDVELLARLTRERQHSGAADLRTAIYECPLDEWRDVQGSKLRGRDFIRAAAELWQIRRSIRRPAAFSPPVAASIAPLRPIHPRPAARVPPAPVSADFETAQSPDSLVV